MSDPGTLDAGLSALVDALDAATTVTVLTGAGVSAESGVPTFRDAQTGIWARYRPEELATPDAFERDPDTVWQWYCWRRQLVRAVEPNSAHRVLAALERELPDLRLVTQNVDGLHARAGHRDVIEFHGNLFRDVCHAEGTAVELEREHDSVPNCPRCGARVRPGVVWFGEAIPADALERALTAAEACDLFLVIGTSAVVYPAAGLIDVAHKRGARIAGINPDAAALDARMDIRIVAPAGDALRAVHTGMGFSE